MGPSRFLLGQQRRTISGALKGVADGAWWPDSPRLVAAVLAAMLAVACGSGAGGGSGNGGSGNGGSGNGGRAGGASGSEAMAGENDAGGEGGENNAGGQGGVPAASTGGKGGSGTTAGNGTTGGAGTTAGSGGNSDGCYSPTTPPGPCVPWTVCVPGERVSREGTRVRDRRCEPCEEGWFSATANASQCVEWQRCAPGEYIAEEGTATSDRRCAACPDGTYSDYENARQCKKWIECGPGRYVAQPGTRVLDQLCRDCVAGFSTTVNASSCSNWRECQRGEYVVDWGTFSSDRVCLPCPNETLSTLTNATECFPWAACAPGTYISQEGTPTKNRSCGTCPTGTFSKDKNTPACSPWTECVAGRRVTAEPSKTVDRQCTDCTTGYTTGPNLTSCTPWKQCSPGEYISTIGTPQTDRACTACAKGTFSAGADANQCQSYSLCSPGAYLTTRGTSSADHVCTPCGAGHASSGFNAPFCSPSQLATGDNYTCLLAADGNLKCWGMGGQLGYGNTDTIGDDETPASVGFVNVGGSIAQISTGGFHTCALLDGGALRCWGEASDGQLGYGNTTRIGDNETPNTAGNINVGGTVVQVDTGIVHTCALLTGGTVRCWGDGGEGRLGYGNSNDIGDNEVPAAAGNVNVGGSVVQLAAGGVHTCALLTDGKVRCWGDGSKGQLGYGNTDDIGDNEAPASAGVVDVGGAVMQLVAGSTHTCALLVNGAVRCWGDGSLGQLGYGNMNAIGDNETPASAGDVPVGGSVVQLAAGALHTCALLESGAVRCWGSGNYGQLGHGNTAAIGDNETPASAGDVALGGSALQIAVGYFHTCALLAADEVRCWGLGMFGQLGYGNPYNIGDNETPAAAGNVPYH